MGTDLNIGHVTAYAYAKSKGYTGTEEQFATELAQFAENAQQVAEDKAAVEQLVDEFLNTTAPAVIQGVTDEGTSQVERVAGAGTAQVTRVGQAGDTQIDAVATEGTTQIGLVTAEGTAQVTRVQDKGDEVIDSIPADYTALTQEVSDLNQQTSDLRSALNSIVEQNQIVLQKADIDSSYDSTYVNEGYIGSSGGFTANSGYRTFYYQVAESASIYIEGIGVPDMYLSLAVYNTSISTGNFSARYRLQDGNLPSSSNKLAVTAGQWLAISYGHSTQEDRDFKLYTGVYEYTDIPTAAFIENINKNEFVGKATKTATSIDVYIGKAKYEINKYNNSTIRAYLWRTNACRILDSNNVYQTVWENSDSDGIVKILGESDYIGGYHGDETETLFKLFVDGVEFAEDSTFSDLDFNEIILYFESDVYHCNTSETPDVVAFKRNKIIKFNNEGYTVCNYWTAQENLTCEISYIGMLSVENGLVNAYSTNADFKYHALDSGTSSSADMTDVCFNTPYGDIGIKISEQKPNEHYGCEVSAYTGRLKVYAANFTSSAYGALNTGDVLKGKATTYFRD